MQCWQPKGLWDLFLNRRRSNVSDLFSLCTLISRDPLAWRMWCDTWVVWYLVPLISPPGVWGRGRHIVRKQNTLCSEHAITIISLCSRRGFQLSFLPSLKSTLFLSIMGIWLSEWSEVSVARLNGLKKDELHVMLCDVYWCLKANAKADAKSMESSSGQFKYLINKIKLQQRC